MTRGAERAARLKGLTMSSILTNTSSMVALQTLKGINKGMGKVQNEISTGMKVATAKDNSSSWAIAATMSTDINSYKKLTDSLTSASALLGVARSAAEQIVDVLKQVQEKVVQAKEPGADLVKLQADVDAMKATINSVAASAQYNGINMVNNTTDRVFTVSVTRGGGGVDLTTFTVAGRDLAAAAGTAITLTATLEVDLDATETALNATIAAAAAFGAAQIRIEGQNDFLKKQMDALKNGLGSIVDADMEEASARLQALQVQQQLGIQALSIANQSPQNILALFR
jgi:flagellin